MAKRKSRKGPDNPNWKGGISDRDKMRRCAKELRMTIKDTKQFMRDLFEKGSGGVEFLIEKNLKNSESIF